MEIYQLINVCLVTEDVVASIYNRFMQLFPQEKDFWEDLYNDEQKHTSFLTNTADSGKFDEMPIADSGFSMPLLDRTKTFIANIRNQIEFNPVSLEEALKIALKIEETMVEAFTNELMANLSPSDESSFHEMLMEEKTHIAKIKNMMIKKGFLKLS
jgi:rubrerythrin